MRLCLLIGIAALSLTSTAARADNFTLSNGIQTFTFSAPGAPSSSMITQIDNGFQLTNISVSQNGGAAFNLDIKFYNGGGAGGGLSLYNEATRRFLVDQVGAQVFSGTDTTPTFTVGTSFALTQYLAGNDVYPGSFTFTDGPILTATPEPSSLCLLGTGILAIVGFANRRTGKITWQI